jgi:hypothetical protein
MDNVERLLSSARPGTIVTDAHMDALREIESSNNPKAVNPKSGAMGAYQFMPSTVSSYAAKGVKFDPFNEPQSREVARQHLQDFVDKNGGDLNKGLAAYGGHITKDPTDYINKFNAALARQAKARGTSPEADQSGEPEDNVIRLLQSAKTVTPEQPKPAPPKLSELSPFGSLGVPEGDLVRKAMKKYLAPKPAETAPAATPAQIPTTTVAPQPAAPKTEYKVGSMADLGKGIVSMADVAAGGLTGLVGQGSYAIQRAMGVPEPEAKKSVAEFVEKRTDPFGRVLGISEDPAYKAEATRRLTNYIGENVGKGAAWIADKTGIPVGDVENMIGSLGLLPIPGAAKVGQKAGAAAYGAEQALRDQFAAKAPPPKVEPGIGAPAPAAGQPKPRIAYADLQAQLAEKKAAKEQAFQELANAPSLREAQARAAQARAAEQAQAQAQAQRAGATATPGSVGAAAVDTPRMRVERAASLPIPITYTRAQATKNPSDVKYGAVAAKTPYLADQVFERNAEQNAQVQQNMQVGIERTGTQAQGISPTDFGQNIEKYVAKLKQERKQDYQNDYKTADAKGEFVEPVDYTPVLNFLKKSTEGRPSRRNRNPLYNIIEEELSANDPTGSGKIGALQLEDVRQAINDETDFTVPREKALAAKVKSLMDKISENAGGDLYKQARKKRAQWEEDFQKQTTVRSINEIKKNTNDKAVDTEKIFDQLFLRKSGDQVRRVFDLLDNSGPEGQQLVRDIKGRFGEHILESTTKSAQLDTKGRRYVSTAELNKLVTDLDKSGKLDLVFGPEGANIYRTLNEVVAEIQTNPKEVLSTSGSGETVLGAFLGTAPFTVAGELIGQATTDTPVVGGMLAAAAKQAGTNLVQSRKIKKEQTKLKDFLNYKP